MSDKMDFGQALSELRAGNKVSKKKVYNAAMLDSGIVCDCPAYQYRGICKHAARLRPLIQRALI